MPLALEQKEEERCIEEVNLLILLLTSDILHAIKIRNYHIIANLSQDKVQNNIV